MKKKQCKKCLATKKLEKFHKDKYSKDGLTNICKECRNAYKRQYNKANKEKISAYNKQYGQANKTVKKVKDQNRYKHTRNEYLKKVSENQELYSARNKASYRKHIYKRLLASARKRATKLNLEFSITIADLNCSEHCPILGEEFTFGSQRIKPHYSSRTIDRLNPNIGYVPGNVLVVSSLANVTKNNGTIEELELLTGNLTKIERHGSLSWDVIFKKEGMTRHPNSETIVYGLLQSCRRRAKIRNRRFSLQKTDLPIPQFCPLLGLPLEKGKGRVTTSSPTIDRKNNLLGYTPKNTIICSHKANRMKNQCSVEQLKKIVKAYKSLIQ